MTTDLLRRVRGAVSCQDEMDAGDEELEDQMDVGQQRKLLQGLFAIADPDEASVPGADEYTYEFIADFLAEEGDHSEDEYVSRIVNVGVELFEDLQELECYKKDSMTVEDAERFVKQYPDDAVIQVRVLDTGDEISVTPHFVGLFGDDVTNARIEKFCGHRMRSSINELFDPLAEGHEEPVIGIRT